MERGAKDSVVTEDGEVISVKDGIATVQGTGRVTFSLIKGANKQEKTIDFSKQNVQKIKI